MARTRGPLGNAPRDLRDDFVGEPAEEAAGGPPPRWPPKPKRVTKNTFHSKVSGNTSPKRADRKSQISPGAPGSPFYRRGGWVHPRARADGGDVVSEDIARRREGTAPAPRPSDEELGRAAGSAERRRRGGSVAEGRDEPVIRKGRAPDDYGLRPGQYRRGGRIEDDAAETEGRRRGMRQTPEFKRGGKVEREEEGEREDKRETRREERREEADEGKYQIGGFARPIGGLARPLRGRVVHGGIRTVAHVDPLRSRTTATRTMSRDRLPGEFKSGGRLTAGERQKLPRSDFALPGKGKGPKGAGAGSYPIPDESHARNALARVSQHGSPEEKARVRAKVKAKYPGIEQS